MRIRRYYTKPTHRASRVYMSHWLCYYCIFYFLCYCCNFCISYCMVKRKLICNTLYNGIPWHIFCIPWNNKHLMTGPEGNSKILFPETKSRETLRFEGNKIQCSPRDQSSSDLLHSKANGWKTNNSVIHKWRATAVNISRVTMKCFLFDIIVFAMLPAHSIWRETVSMLDVMCQYTS